MRTVAARINRGPGIAGGRRTEAGGAAVRAAAGGIGRLRERKPGRDKRLPILRGRFEDGGKGGWVSRRPGSDIGFARPEAGGGHEDSDQEGGEVPALRT
jgi:hypothetical protein